HPPTLQHFTLSLHDALPISEVEATEANLKFAKEERARYDDLMKSGSGTIQRAQQTDAALRAQTAALQQGKAGLIAANKKVEVLRSEEHTSELQSGEELVCRL